MKILLIDDDRDFLLLLGQSLRKQGYHVHTAASGIEALEVLGEKAVDLIISDVLMADTPIMSFTCMLRKLYPSVPIILVSGLPAGPLIHNSLTLGANEFVPKPVNMQVLCKSINRLGAA
jgi:DNA-binding NtrC family response regulator